MGLSDTGVLRDGAKQEDNCCTVDVVMHKAKIPAADEARPFVMALARG